VDSASESGDGGGGYGVCLRDQLTGLAGLVEQFEPDRYRGEDARVLTELFAWGEKLCATGRALAAARVADTGSWQTSGEPDAASWLARLSGQTPAQAAGAIRTARRFRTQPDLDAAARAGRLSDAQQVAVGAAAAGAPHTTGELLDRAGVDTLAGLQQRSRQIRLGASSADEESARYRRCHQARYLRVWTDDNGTGRLSGSFTPDALAEIRAALAPFQHQIFTAARRAGTRERRECHTADALVAMARAATHQAPAPHTTNNPTTRSDSAGGADPAGGAPAEPGPDVPFPLPGSPRGAGPGTVLPGSPPPAGAEPGLPDRGRRPATIIVRIDHAALIRGWRHADECCEIDGIGPVPVATVRAMMTDAFLAAVVTDGTDVRSVAHLGRAVTATQRTALIARDPQCVIPGCHTRHDLEIDHVQNWATTKTTTLDNLARLCHHHHALKTYEGWQLHGPPGHWTWHPPTNPPPHPPRPDAPTPEHPHSQPTPPASAHPGGTPQVAARPQAQRGASSASVAATLFDPGAESVPP
jgi:hypothetical protein